MHITARAPTINCPDAIVIAGGGSKSMAGIGALHILKRNGHLKNVKVFAGTSAGAIAALGMALDRNAIDMCKAFVSETYKPNFDIGNFTNTFGIDTGMNLYKWIDLVMGNKDYTFQKILEETGITLVICATNLSKSAPVYFSPSTTPNFDVRLAVRMSCSLPVVFSAVRHEDEIYVDGALTDAFPIDYVANLPNVKNVLGIRYDSTEYSSLTDINSIDKFFMSLIAIATKDKYSPDANVITIDVGDLSVLDFKNPKKLKGAFKLGVNYMRDFLKKNE